MHRASLPETERHLWELTEADSSCLTLLHNQPLFTAATTAPELKTLQVKTFPIWEHTSGNTGHHSQNIVCVVYSDCTPEHLAAIMNCSRQERHTRNYDYMEGGDVRIRQLFSRTQWFLTVDDDGNINGTQDPTNCYSILEIRTVSEGGILAIKGIKSQYYIAMNKSGQLQGKTIYNENCNFKEVFLENYFNAYSSAKWTKKGKEMFIALSQKGRPLRGKKTRREHIASHFIPMKCREEERRLD